MWLQALLFLLVALIGVLLYGAWRWRAGTYSLRARLDAARAPQAPGVFHSKELEGLPACVQNYFRAVLPEAHPLIASARLRHTGTFNLGNGVERWRPFESTQYVVASRPGFDWDARIAMAPGIKAFVHDAYAAGEGILRVEALGLIPIVQLRGTPELARGELQRYLAEAVWYPTRLLPRYGVEWEEIDETSAKATLRDRDRSATLTFRFDADGLIASVYADARYRIANGATGPAPWEGRFWNYERRGGMAIPVEGEVSWLLPEGRWPYWRGRITNIEYNFERRT
jgi:hypothetical protein